MTGGEEWNIWAYEGDSAAVHQVLVTALEAVNGQAWKVIDVIPA